MVIMAMVLERIVGRERKREVRYVGYEGITSMYHIIVLAGEVKRTVRREESKAKSYSRSSNCGCRNNLKGGEGRLNSSTDVDDSGLCAASIVCVEKEGLRTSELDGCSEIPVPGNLEVPSPTFELRMTLERNNPSKLYYSLRVYQSVSYSTF